MLKKSTTARATHVARAGARSESRLSSPAAAPTVSTADSKSFDAADSFAGAVEPIANRPQDTQTEYRIHEFLLNLDMTEGRSHKVVTA